jgi:hypothetical protein
VAITTGDLSGTLGCGVGKYFIACSFRELASSDLPGVLMMFFTLCFTFSVLILWAESDCVAS